MDKTILFSTQWYEQRVHLGVLRYAQEHRWDVLSSHHLPGLVPEAPDADGQIVEIGYRDRKRLRVTQEFKGPVIGLEDFGESLDVPRVHTDNHAVGKLAARHLLDRNFSQFATLSRNSFHYVLDRLEGFHNEIGKVPGTECLDLRCAGGVHQKELSPKKKDVPSMESVLTLDRPIGVFCPDDDVALILIRFLERNHVSVPEEVAVVGVNNDPVICPFASVPISSVDVGFERIGYKAAELLGRMTKGKAVATKAHLVKPTGVEVRRSSDIQAVEDVLVARALRFIWDQAEEWVSISDIAAHVKLPVRTLQWKFSKRMGYPIQNELTKSRVERVKNELLYTAKSTGQIAEDLNFSSVQYMIRVFSKETGLSPLKYRRHHEGSN